MRKCKVCKTNMSRYGIDVMDQYLGMIPFKLNFCWRCGHFGISPNVDNEFTTSIMMNPAIIYDLIKSKQLKPIP